MLAALSWLLLILPLASSGQTSVHGLTALPLDLPAVPPAFLASSYPHGLLLVPAAVLEDRLDRFAQVARQGQWWQRCPDSQRGSFVEISTGHPPFFSCHPPALDLSVPALPACSRRLGDSRPGCTGCLHPRSAAYSASDVRSRSSGPASAWRESAVAVRATDAHWRHAGAARRLRPNAATAWRERGSWARVQRTSRASERAGSGRSRRAARLRVRAKMSRPTLTWERRGLAGRGGG